MLDVLHVKKTIDGKEVLKDCTFKVEPNTVFGIVGINGVGKSTLMKICCGILNPDEGSVFIGTETIFDNISAKENIVFISDDPYYELGETVESIFNFYAAFYKIDKKYFLELLNIFDLHRKDRLVKLSKGKRKRVFIAIALAIAPKLLLLDETFDGLDPKAKKIFKQELIKLIQAKEMTVIMTSHSLRELSDIVDDIGYLRNGVLLTIGSENYSNDPIYRVMIKNNNISVDFSNLKVLRTSKGTGYEIYDIHNEKEQIINALGEYNGFYAIDVIPFEEWIVYQMEDIY